MSAGDRSVNGGSEAGTATAGSSAAGDGSGGADAGGSGGERELGVFVFSRTAGYRHSSIETGVMALKQLGVERGWRVEASEDAGAFTDESLQRFDVIVFLSTTGEVLDASQQGAMERFVRAGRGFVGVHSASDTEYDWGWYGELVGAYFKVHPAIQQAQIVVEDASHAATMGLPSTWTRTDEWYGFKTNPRQKVHVLLRLDESTYEPADSAMGEDHPIAWCHEYDGGRSCYTALGHTEASYAEALFRSHLAGAITWAAGG